jgi:hypothetical protein
VKLTRRGLRHFFGVIVNLVLEASNLDQTGESAVDNILVIGDNL